MKIMLKQDVFLMPLLPKLWISSEDFKKGVVPVLAGMFGKRKKGYKAIGYDV